MLSFFETDQVDNGRRAGDVDLSGFQRRNHGHLVAKHGNLDAVKIWLVRLPVVAVPTALGYWGGQMIIRRARERTGIARLHSHLFRHGIAHRAAARGAHPGEIQLLLGQTSTAMARRYTGSAAKRQGARLMPQYSPI